MTRAGRRIRSSRSKARSTCTARPRLREKLVELVSEGHRQIVVDLEGVDFLDSTGLGVLVGGLKRLRSHDGDLSLVCTQARILKVFEITGLTSVFSIASTVDEATTAG